MPGLVLGCGGQNRKNKGLPPRETVPTVRERVKSRKKKKPLLWQCVSNCVKSHHKILGLCPVPLVGKVEVSLELHPVLTAFLPL